MTCAEGHEQLTGALAAHGIAWQALRGTGHGIRRLPRRMRPWTGAAPRSLEPPRPRSAIPIHGSPGHSPPSSAVPLAHGMGMVAIRPGCARAPFLIASPAVSVITRLLAAAPSPPFPLSGANGEEIKPLLVSTSACSRLQTWLFTFAPSLFTWMKRQTIHKNKGTNNFQLGMPSSRSFPRPAARLFAWASSPSAHPAALPPAWTVRLHGCDVGSRHAWDADRDGVK